MSSTSFIEVLIICKIYIFQKHLLKVTRFEVQSLLICFTSSLPSLFSLLVVLPSKYFGKKQFLSHNYCNMFPINI